MSRIQQLVQPERRAIGGSALLPLIGLALAGAAFYAHAQFATPTTVVVQATGSVHKASPTVATAQGLPTPQARPGVQVLPSAAPPAQARSAAANTSDRDSSYALVGPGDRQAMSGDHHAQDEISAARRAVDGEFLWFRRDGSAWVVRDAETIARVRAAWAETEAMGERVQAIEARMEPHARHLEALGRRMESLHVDDAFESPEARAAMAKMETMGERMGPLVERQVALAMHMREASDADAPRLERERERLEHEQESLHREMEQHSATLQMLDKRMEAQLEPLEALGRQMEAASEPMERIGKEMEAMGARIEREAELADAQVRQLIDEAYRSGKAQPAPARR